MLGLPSQHPIGAVCGSAARTDLTGGRWVTIVPTGTDDRNENASDQSDASLLPRIRDRPTPGRRSVQARPATGSTIGNDCIQRSITSPQRNTNNPYRRRTQVPYLNSQAGNCPAISLSHCKGAFQTCPEFAFCMAWFSGTAQRGPQ